MVRIPNEYQEVEYIESTGTQFIIADRYLSEDVEVDFKGSYTSYGQRYASLFGAITASNSNPAFVLFRDINGEAKIGGRFGKWTNAASSYVSTDVVYSYGGIFECKCGINWIECEGSRYTDGLIWDNALSSAKMGLFCRALGDSPFSNSFANGKIYYLTISNNSGIIANFIPCYRKSDNEIGMYDTVSKQFYTNSGTGTFLKGNDVAYDNINLLESRRRILLNTPHIETISDTIAGFKTDVATKLKWCKIHFTPIQEGEGDPSPENVRPITGWDGVKIYTSKRNLLIADEITFTSGKYINGSGAIANSSYYKISNVIPCSHLAGKTISFNTIIGSTSTTVTSIGFYKNKTINTDNCVLCAHRESNSKAYSTVTVPSTAKYMVICLNTSITLDGKYIVEGSTPPQEIDTPTTLTIPFPQTIYGGYADLIKGEVVETEYYYNFANETPTWSSGLSNPNNQYFTPLPYMISGYLSNDNRTLCNKLNKVTNNNQGAGVRFGANNVVVYFYNMSELDEIEAAIDVRNYLKNNDVAIVYPLATPNTYSIDPQTLKTLRGMNNIWSDANGNIEVSFYTH